MKKVLLPLPALFFLFAIVVQFNDPDPWAWIIHYGIALLLNLFIIFRKPAPFILWRTCLIYFIFMVFYFVRDNVWGVNPLSEVYSELGGIGLVGLFYIFIYFKVQEKKI